MLSWVDVASGADGARGAVAGIIWVISGRYRGCRVTFLVVRQAGSVKQQRRIVVWPVFLVFLVGVPGLGSPGTRGRCPLRCRGPVPGAARVRAGPGPGRVSGIVVHDHEGLSCCGELSGNIAENSP